MKFDGKPHIVSLATAQWRQEHPYDQDTSILQSEGGPAADGELSGPSRQSGEGPGRDPAGSRTGRFRSFACRKLFQSQYFCQTEDEAFFDLAESIPGPSTEALSALARRHRMAMVVPLFERRAAGVYHNTAVVLDADGALLGSYRKMHIPDDPLYYEKFYFTPGGPGLPHL